MDKQTGKALRLERIEGSFWKLIFDLPGEKVNKLNRQVLGELQDLLPELERLGQSQEIEVLILRSGKKDQFIAGADIQLIQSAKTADEATDLARQGQKLLNRWEDLPFPTVAAIQGACLGGGFEWALASSAILMAEDRSTRVGLPEVLLGILPGMGGCVRLPRKVGLAQALDFILSSRMLSAEKAYRSGLIEGVLLAEQFDSQVLAWVAKNRERLKEGVRLARQPKLGGAGGAIGALLENTPMGRALILKKARDGVLNKTKGKYPAPLEVIEILRSNSSAYASDKIQGKARDRSLDREAKGFGKCAATDESKNLINLFFLTESVKKSTGVSDKIQGHSIQQAAVLGAGIMGGGIAQLFADKQLPVRMKDLTVKALEAGVQAASKLWKKKLERKQINPREYQQRLNLIAPTLDYLSFESVDIVVEAVIEKIEVKRSVLAEVEKVVRPGCIIASNTSSLSISRMQEGMNFPGRIVGMHFFNPVHRMPLVEIIRGMETSDEAVATVFQLSKQLGKTPIVVKDVPGFLVNRLLSTYLNEATLLVEAGVSIEELDRVILDFGMPMGPMELIDEVGLDVGDKVSRILHDAYGDRMKPSSLNLGMLQSGRLGKKSGKGFYTYSDFGKTKHFEQEVYSVLNVSPQKGKVSAEEIVYRCILPMINEASRALEEEVVSSPGELDLGMIMGIGFPPFRGGLLRYADHLGADFIVARLKELSQKEGSRFEPAPSLINLAEKGLSFYS